MAAPLNASLWTCPACGRQFRTRNQWHSCAVVTVHDHFEGKPAWMRDTFQALVSQIEERAGAVRVDATRAGINLAARAHFAGFKPTRKDLGIGFLLRRSEGDPRIANRQDLGGGWVSHVVRITSPTEADAQLLNWLLEAYAAKA